MPEWFLKTQALLESNSFVAWISVAGLSFVFALGVKFLLALISVRLRKIVEATVSKWDDIAVDIVDGFKIYYNCRLDFLSFIQVPEGVGSC